MSLVKVDEIRDETGSTTIPPSIPGLQPQLAQAWVNFDGIGTVAIRDQHNVTSITDNGAGNYTVNFTNSLAGSDYAVVYGGNVGSGAPSFRTLTKTTSSFNVLTFNNNVQADADEVSLVVLST